MIHRAPLWPHGDPARVARDVLAQSGYRHAPLAPAEKSWLERLLDAIGDLWHRLTDGLHIPAGPLLGLSKFIDVVLVVIAVALIAVGVFRLLARWWEKPRPQTLRGSLTDAAAIADLRDEAERAAARGEYARAIALLFGIALRALDENDLVAFDPARTPGEYRRLVRRSGTPSAAPFEELSGRFVRASFAPGTPSRDEYERAQRALSAFEFAVAGA